MWTYGPHPDQYTLINQCCMGMQGLTLEGVRRKLKEFHGSIGEEGGEEDAERQRAKIMNLMMGLGYEELKQESPQPPPPEAPANGVADMGNSPKRRPIFFMAL